LRQAWDNLFGRVDGPMSFRLIIQPLVATFLAVRAGWEDAREGRPIFFWTLAREPARTRVMLRNLWRIAGKVFLVALVLDALSGSGWRWTNGGRATRAEADIMT